MSKEILFGNDAREKLLEGIDLVAKAVTKTLGPKGKNSILSNITAPPTVTNDGVTIARYFNIVKDPWVNTGVQMIKEVAIKQNEPGDGTTTATLLAASMIHDGIKALSAGIDSIVIQDGIRRASLEIIEKLKKIAKPAETKEDLIKVATISVEDDKSGVLIGSVMHEVGKDGAVTVEVHKGVDIEKETAQGMRFDQGYMSQLFITDWLRYEANLGDVNILVTDHVISHNDEILPIVEQVAANKRNMLVIICDDMRGEAMQTTIANTANGKFRFLVIPLPGLDSARSDNGVDIATVCGAKFIHRDLEKLQNVKFEDLGSAEQLISKADSTTISRGAGKKKDIEKWIEILKGGLKSQISDFDRDQLKERIARVSQGVGVVKVGAPSQQELNYKKLKVEDALAATRAAMEEGVVPGGGVALLRLARSKQPDDPGEKILYDAIEMPIRQIAKNANKNDDEIIDQIIENENFDFGWDAKTDKFVDMINSGIIDPLKVVRKAIENAVSVAVTFLGTESLICEVDEEKK